LRERAGAAIPRAIAFLVLCRMLRGTIGVRAFLDGGWWFATLLQMQACTSRRIAGAHKQRVILANVGQLVERFEKPAAYGGKEACRFCIQL